MISALRTTVHFWRKRPIRVVALAALITALTFGGPAACFVHCLLLDAAHHQPHVALFDDQQRHIHEHHRAAAQADCPSAAQHTQHSEHAEPSALTVAILLPLALLPHLLVVSFEPLIESPPSLSIALQPPRRPPRLA
jgi:hypothetical protein